jgi:hypothetical protein
MANTPPAAAAQSRATPAKGKAQVASRPFRIGTQPVDIPEYSNQTQLTAASQDLPVYQISPAGFLRHLYLVCSAVATGNTGTNTASFVEDGPFSVYDTITFEDVNQKQIVGPFTGWDFYILNKFGGYSFGDDAKASPIFTAQTSTASSAAGSFTFALRIPVEINPRNTLGSLPNKSATSEFKVRLRLAPSTNVYSTASTNLPTVNTTIAQVDYWEPNATDLRGRPLAQTPPAINTLQLWHKTDYGGVATTMTRQKIEGTGYPWRNIIFVLRGSTAATARANGETDWPNPLQVLYQNQVLANKSKARWQDEIYRNYRLPLVGDVLNLTNGAGYKDNGVYNIPFNQGFVHKPGFEDGRQYLPTDSGTFVGLTGNPGATTAAHTLTVFINDLVPVNNNDLALTGGI